MRTLEVDSMMGNIVNIGNRKVEVVPNITPLEAILEGNKSIMKGNRRLIPIEMFLEGKECKTMVPNTFFNQLLLGKKAGGAYKDVQEILESRPWHTGTAFVVEAKGKVFGKYVINEFKHKGKPKVLVYSVQREHQGMTDTMILCDHGFDNRLWRENEPLISLLNLKNGKTIWSLDEADEIGFLLHNKIRLLKAENRLGGCFEPVGDGNTWSWISDTAALGLLCRGLPPVSRDYRVSASYDYRSSVLATDELEVCRTALFFNKPAD